MARKPLSALLLFFAMTAPAAIVAAEEAPARRFDGPAVTGQALAGCLTSGQGCGQAAADSWCSWRGFGEARQFDLAPRPPHVRALHIGDGSVCEGDCTAFESITCSAPAPPANG